MSDAYPVETISQALQGLSAPASSAAESTDPTPDSSLMLQAPHPDAHGEPHSTEKQEEGQGGEGGDRGGVEQSWSSEFKTESEAESEQPSLVGDSIIHGGEDDAVSRWTSAILMAINQS